MQENLSDEIMHSYLPFIQRNHNYLYSYLPSTRILKNYQLGHASYLPIALRSHGNFKGKKACPLQAVCLLVA